MRWLYADPHNPEEAAYVQQTVAAIDNWWQEFQDKREKIERAFEPKSRYNLPKFMEGTLQAIHPGLMWEFGAAVKQKPGHRLVITPESQRYLRPMVRTILERAPKLPNWEFYAYRLAESPEEALAMIKPRAGFDVKRAVLSAALAPGRKVDLFYGFPEDEKLDEDHARQAAFVITETLFGEQFLDNWIGEMGLLSDRPDAARPQELPQAQITVATLVRGIFEKLPNQRCQDISQDDEGWAIIDLEPPEEATDYAGRGDLLAATIHDLELFQAMHSGQPFASACHSKVHEQFCYLKIDAEQAGSDGIVNFRCGIEEALNPELLAANLGGCIGGGSGLQYAYIDLALTDVKHAVPVIRKVLTRLQVPPRSWLLFHDDDLSAEWIGLHPETPPPPEPLEVDGDEVDGDVE